MQVAFDTNTILSAPGGAATYFLELLPELLKLADEHDELFVFSADESDAQPLPFLLRDEKLHGVNAPFGRGKIWRSLRFPAVERLLKNPDFEGTLDVCHSFHPPLMPSRAARRVLSLHAVPGDGVTLPGPTRSSLMQAEIVITPSRSLADALLAALDASPEARMTLDHKLRVIPPAAHARYTEPPTPASVELLCQRFPFLEEAYLLAVGAAAEPDRSVPLLAQAYMQAIGEDDSLPALVFVAPEENVSSVADVLASTGDDDGRLLVMEEVATDELPALYAGSEFLLHPGFGHTFGSAVLEAASLGIPAIVGSGAGVLEVLGSSLMVPGHETPESWAATMLDLHRDQQRKAERIAEAKTRARIQTWAAVAEAHWKLYRS